MSGNRTIKPGIRTNKYEGGRAQKTKKVKGAYYEDAGFAWNYWNTLEDVPIYSAINMSGDRVGKIYKVGSRKSQLAMLQTEFVIKELKTKYPHHNFEIVGMSTVGDLILDVALAKVGEKSMFTKELELAILQGEVDFVVHSLKDLPTILPTGLTIAAILAREDPRDVIVLPKGKTFDDNFGLSKDTVFGTSSSRRTAGVRFMYPNARVVDVRGNLQTRLKKLDDPTTPYTALILAAAGLQRLGLGHRISRYLDKNSERDWPFAVGQGALAVECLASSEEVKNLLTPLTDPSTYFCCLLERAVLSSFGGGCSVPLGIRTCFKVYPVTASYTCTLTLEAYYYGESHVIEMHEEIVSTFDCTPDGDPNALTGITPLQFEGFDAWSCRSLATLGRAWGRKFAAEAQVLELVPSGSMAAAEVSSSKTYGTKHCGPS